MSDWIVAPHLAYTKSGPGHKGVGSPTNHATRDGLKTLCGCHAAGHDRTVPFIATSVYSCRRCVAALARESAARLAPPKRKGGRPKGWLNEF